jgi:cyclophilin family peptidyl-prolyl cis-trans isomerase
MIFILCSWHDGKYTVFGKVIDGWDVLDALESVGS